MTDVATLIADLVAAGTPPALVGRVASALATPSQDDELSADRRQRDRMRKRLSREKSMIASAENPRNVRGQGISPSPPPAPSPDKEIPPTPPKENNLFPEPPPQPRVSGAREFDAFWDRFPNKVGKADARKAFSKAITKIGAEPMMVALDRYAQKTDDRPWCNPATWLNQERWTDQPANGMPRASPRRVSAIEQGRNELMERIENEHGIGREESSDPRHAGRVGSLEPAVASQSRRLLPRS